MKPVVTGLDLIARMVAEARRRGVRTEDVARLVTDRPARWMAKLALVQDASQRTIGRVESALRGEPLVAQPVQVRRPAARPIHYVECEPPVPAVLPFERRSCFWCGTRSDIGCHHLGMPDREAA